MKSAHPCYVLVNFTEMNKKKIRDEEKKNNDPNGLRDLHNQVHWISRDTGSDAFVLTQP